MLAFDKPIVLLHQAPGHGVLYDRVCSLSVHFDTVLDRFVVAVEGNCFGARGFAHYHYDTRAEAQERVQKIVTDEAADGAYMPDIKPVILAIPELSPQALFDPEKRCLLRLDLRGNKTNGDAPYVIEIKRDVGGAFRCVLYVGETNRAGRVEFVEEHGSAGMDLASAALLASVEARRKISDGSELRPAAFAYPIGGVKLRTALYRDFLAKRSAAGSVQHHAPLVLAAATETCWAW